ncbi:unnamed protein product [Microthlaspi erraticum]|uniref:Uncharacterized protein n=1 Tax=Microthlaspi erraticum TaxID=1685480 RepID=A0A6D2HQR4_9BRAS|nr:unnamed protein product [Microthlaspi erraticum]CAA7057202.1 unnamed protein product [Microthlaspi erraticum]
MAKHVKIQPLRANHTVFVRCIAISKGIAISPKWARKATARDPSTVKSGRWTLLCETSLTQSPPTLGDMKPEPSLKAHASTPNLEWAGQIIAQPEPGPMKSFQRSIILLSPLGSQARATELDVQFVNLVLCFSDFGFSSVYVHAVYDFRRE